MLSPTTSQRVNEIIHLDHGDTPRANVYIRADTDRQLASDRRWDRLALAGWWLIVGFMMTIHVGAIRLILTMIRIYTPLL